MCFNGFSSHDVSYGKVLSIKLKLRPRRIHINAPKAAGSGVPLGAIVAPTRGRNSADDGSRNTPLGTIVSRDTIPALGHNASAMNHAKVAPRRIQSTQNSAKTIDMN
ncbi:hypothetical protein EVAR_77682_1 [Eumeta japonica]|uniref:Uncharacterized protein n=1 Tax=Eumeta variegata TaxID=151549 RepID=A0A4C2AD17_EUMVA|nr:hypothetical protein EVAR_77682_1 [Eumeta japonica]